MIKFPIEYLEASLCTDLLFETILSTCTVESGSILCYVLSYNSARQEVWLWLLDVISMRLISGKCIEVGGLSKGYQIAASVRYYLKIHNDRFNVNVEMLQCHFVRPKSNYEEYIEELINIYTLLGQITDALASLVEIESKDEDILNYYKSTHQFRRRLKDRLNILLNNYPLNIYKTPY